ncbi:MAG: glycoside hydrolase family 3 C-terminal domain-containing protein, partial [Anaerolineae bacterium]|nr:glycoside hydrolase family 3 C-terminal domain-containing protein [Anaerolineae bacterium]
MEKFVEEKLSALTLAEKVSLLAAADMWHTMAVERAGIPVLKVTDGPNGARGQDGNTGPTSADFPIGMAMGATWNPDLIKEVGKALAEETTAKGAHVLLAPTVNIHRTPNAGRNFECFSEDPFLSGTLASAYINGLQENGVAACIKHFVANDQEFERNSMSSEVTERPLHEIYLEPFRIAIENAQPWSIMSGYNRLNGTHVSEHDWLLHDILKERWGYDGLVMSDWYGTYSDGVPGGYLDLEMPGPARWMNPEKIIAAVEAGDLEESHIDDKARRLLRILLRVGAFDKPELAAEQAIDKPEHRELIRKTAVEAMVLLKNKNDVLPINLDETKTIAVIGENAKWAQIMGGGSSQVNPHYTVSPLAGILNRVGDKAVVNYEIGTPVYKEPPLLDISWLTAVDGTPGLTLEYFDGLELAGDSVHTQVIKNSTLTFWGAVDPYVDPSNFSARLSATLTVPETRSYEFQLSGIGQSRLLINGEVVVAKWAEETQYGMAAGTVDLVAGESYDMVTEFITSPQAQFRILRVSCPPALPDDPIQTAVNAAAQADVAIVVAGLNREWESEGFDRPDLELVGKQNELIARVAAVNPNTIVVVNVGSAVTMPWIDDVTAVLYQWYAGQETGNALADLLFGDVSPSGKLPTTFPVRYQDNPAYINFPGENGKVYYGEGLFVGYRFYDKKEIAPLFPFGHGLSYTTFAYDNLKLNGDSFGEGDEILVSVDVTNTGKMVGQEIVQVYVHDVASRLVRPLREL